MYINDEKNAGEPANLSIPIPVIPLIPERDRLRCFTSVRENRTFSDVLLIMGTVLDPRVFPTIKDKPRQQQYHIESENIEAFTQKINGNLKQAYTVVKSENATLTHIDVHFGRGGDKGAANLENAAVRKGKEYQAAHESFLRIVEELRARREPISPRAAMLCEIERLGRSISAKPNVITFGVNYDGVLTREAQSFMHRLAKIKYPAVQGCQNYLVMRANWIDHWVKAIQSGLVNTLAKGMAQSYTDLAAQHAVTRVETVQTLTPPPVPQGIPRFISRGIPHSTNEAFPPYLQPKVTFIEELSQFGMVDTDVEDDSPVISSDLSGLRVGGGVSERQRRDLLATPPRGPTQDVSVNRAGTRSVVLVKLSDESGAEDRRYSVDDSPDQETSQSLISHSWTRDPDSSSAESSQSLVPHSLECELGSTDQNPQIGDLVVVYLRCTGRGRKRRQVTRTGIVKEIDSRDPQRVKTDTCSRKFRKVLEICQRRSTSMISNDTESQSEYSISQYY